MTKWVDLYEIDGHRILLKAVADDGVASIADSEYPSEPSMGSAAWHIYVDGVERGAIAAGLEEEPPDLYRRVEEWWHDQKLENPRFPDSPSAQAQCDEREQSAL